MALPHNALVLVADGRKLLFLRNHGDRNQIDLRIEAHDERDGLKDHEIKSDAPGTTKQSFGFGAPAFDETDFHQQDKDRWARDAADELKRARAEERFRGAGDHRPAEDAERLSKELHKEVERRIVLTLTKEMTDRPIPDIEDLLVGEAAPPA